MSVPPRPPQHTPTAPKKANRPQPISARPGLVAPTSPPPKTLVLPRKRRLVKVLLLIISLPFTSPLSLITKTFPNPSPRFSEFLANHAFFTSSTSDHTSNILSGGVGPICSTGTPNQMVRALGFFKGLSATPFIEERPSWVETLADSENLNAILSEVQDFMKTGDQSLWEDLGTHKGQDTGWSQISMVDFFSESPAFSPAFPSTSSILKNSAGSRIGPRHVAIARQKRGKGIPEHCDLFNWMLTLHLPLIGPSKNCGIIVDGERRDWVPLKPSIMDTTFLHETYNESEEDCILLLVDFWHSELVDLERDELKEFLLLTNDVGQNMKSN